MNERANLPYSDQYASAAKSWVDAESAADLLEATKSAVLAQRMAQLGEMPVAKAERIVKSSPEWMDHVTKVVEARKAANLAKVKCEFLRMKFNEQSSHEATRRAEMRM